MKKPKLTIEGRRAMTGRMFVMPFYIGFIFLFLRSTVQSLLFVFSDVSLKPGGFDIKWIGLKNLKYITEKGCAVEIRYPLVAGYNDSECSKIGSFLKPLSGITKVKVLRYHRFAASRYAALGMENTLPNTETTPQDMEKAIETLKEYGLNVSTE